MEEEEQEVEVEEEEEEVVVVRLLREASQDSGDSRRRDTADRSSRWDTEAMTSAEALGQGAGGKG